MNDLCSLPDDILIEILSNISAYEIENVVSFLNLAFLHKIRTSNKLWKRLCQITGKLALPIPQGLRYRDHYHSIPCIPVDFATVGEALTSFTDCTKPFTITVLPGIHAHDTIDLCIYSAVLPYIPEHEKYYDSDIVGGQIYLNKQIVQVCIQAAFPEKLTALVCCNHDKSSSESPCINLYTRDHDTDLEHRGLFHLEVKHISFFHNAKGNNIWVGNAVARVHGSNTLLSLTSCSLQSDSGRGVIVTRGARLWIKDSTIHNCAATGIYVGDGRTSCLIQRCDIIYCGFGTRSQYIHEHLSMERKPVPPGHSGIYVEGTVGVIIDDSLVAGNSLTGMSVVRSGAAALRNSSILENGRAPVALDEPLDNLVPIGDDIEDDIRYLTRGNVKNLGGNVFGQSVSNPKALDVARNSFRSSYCKINSKAIDIQNIMTNKYKLNGASRYHLVST